jgi:hypothetical protein
MVQNDGFRPEDEQEQLQLVDKDETIDFSFKRPEIHSGLSIKFYDANKPDRPLEDRSSFVPLERKVHFGFNSQPKPWLPPTVREKLEKMEKGIIGREELADLIKKIAEISIDFYNIEPEHFIAVKFDGRIVEDADSEIELLLRVQGRKYGMPVFVWHVGYESFLGWSP